MLRTLICLACIVTMSALDANGQCTVFDEGIRTAQLVVDRNPFLPPVIQKDKGQHITLSWDNMSHEYQRYIYHIQHCTWDWKDDDGLFESEYLSGSNDLPVEEYLNSFNTTLTYTHYSLTLPNENTSFLLSGNYRVLIYQEGEEENPALEFRFCIRENAASLIGQVSSDTDIDFNRSHQQVSMKLSYPTLSVVEPAEQIHTVVVQNRRPSQSIANASPDIRTTTALEWTHNRDLIFDAGNEFHRFEILDVHQSGMNVDNMRWYEPFYHATLWEDKPGHNHLTDQDQNGAFYPRTQDQANNDTESEYLIVHFILRMPRINDTVYVNGQWCNGEFDPKCVMQYNDQEKYYEAAILLKQGYYNYQYITSEGSAVPAMGSFWETENEYQIFAYYRDQGGRYDRLAAYLCIHSGR